MSQSEKENVWEKERNKLMDKLRSGHNKMKMLSKVNHSQSMEPQAFRRNSNDHGSSRSIYIAKPIFICSKISQKKFAFTAILYC